MNKQIEYKIEAWSRNWIKNSNYSIGGYWEEKPLACIGGNNMSYLGRAFDPVLTRNVNGDIKLTFSMYDKFIDVNGEITTSIYTGYVFNEAYIKLQYNNDWYDFIVKEITHTHSENGELKYDVSCSMLAIEELSKNGTNLSFSLDEANCIGNIGYFSNLILNGTDWAYDAVRTKKSNLTEYCSEFLYQATLISGVENCKNIPTYINASTTHNFSIGDTVYIPVSQLTFTNNTPSIATTNLQIIYDSTYIYENEYTINKCNNWTIPKSCVNVSTITPSNFYGYKVVTSYNTKWDNTLSRYLTEYKDNNDTLYYGYTTTKVTATSETEATSTTIYHYVHYTDGNLDSLIVLGDAGAPGATQGSKYQIWLDLNAREVWQYNGTTWIKDSSLNFNDYSLGSKSIVEYTLINPKAVLVDKQEKSRSLIADHSNRFNLLQNVAEIFDLWARFDCQHKPNGAIDYSENTQNSKIVRVYKKYVYFVDNFGSTISYGFRYGMNLQSISRNDISSSLTTKLNVEKIDNSNAEDGICMISTAHDNLSKENFIFNFDYFTQMGLIPRNDLINDLYGTSPDDLAYLNQLQNINKQYSIISEQLNGTNGFYIQQVQLKADVELAHDSYNAAYNQKQGLLEKKNNKQLTVSELQFYNSQYGAPTSPGNVKIAQLLATYTALNAKLTQFGDENGGVIRVLETSLVTLLEQKKSLNEKFYKKYSQYIYEGTWTGSDYVSSDSYYYDAQKTLQESSRPSVSYTVNVIDIQNAFDPNSNYPTSLFSYNLGDKSYVIDTDFFKQDSSVLKPYQEDIIISQDEIHLDNFTANTITVQNYKTDFDSLFQRTTSSMQSYELSKNSYDRAGAAITPVNEINLTTLQNSLLNNSLILSQSHNNTVIQDDTGITLTDYNTPKYKVRVVSRGIYLSRDGGATWNLGLSAENGINAEQILTGRLDASRINITCGDYAPFSWDSYGINAYKTTLTNGAISAIDYGSFVRFDKYGLYSLKGAGSTLEEIFSPTKLSDITNNDHLAFSLTEDGVKIITKNGSIALDSLTDSFTVKNSNGKTVIQLGKLSSSQYGLRISKNNSPVLETTSEGDLWLKGILNIDSPANNTSVLIGPITTNENNDTQMFKIESGGIAQIQMWDNGDFIANKADIRGTITASAGSIGGLIISEESLKSSTTFYDGILKKYIPIFSITSDGVFSAYNASLQGKIIANEGLIGGISISNNGLSVENSFLITPSNGIIISKGTIGGITIVNNSIVAYDGGIDGGGNPTYYYKLNPTGIQVKNGQIAGFNISEQGLVSGQNIALLNNGTLQLGQEGRILLSSATDDLFLRAPSSDSTVILKSGSVSLTKDGILKLGNIYFNGSNSNSILQSSLVNPTWSLNSDGLAIFNNAVIRGEIVTSVFKSQSIQAAGGSWIFRPSAKITGFGGQTNQIIIDQADISDFHVNDIVVLVSSNSQLETYISAIENTTITLATSQSLESFLSIIDYGTDGDWVIGINSMARASGQLEGRSISIKSINTDVNHNSSWTTKVILGDLSTTIPNGGVGLYAQNAYLQGSLTTSTNGIYSGINTLSDILNDSGNENSQIIFWAGSNSIDSSSIKSSPFKVTRDGSLYAQKGIFEGSIITKADIQASRINASRIEGGAFYPDSTDNALTIYNKIDSTGSNAKIYFKDIDGTSLLQLGADGLYLNDILPVLSVKRGATISTTLSANTIKTLRINFGSVNSDSINTYLEKDTTEEKISVINNNIITAYFDEQNNAKFSKNISVGENFMLGNSTFTKRVNGYDIYVE